MHTDKHRFRRAIGCTSVRLDAKSLSVSICVYLWLILLTSCGSKPADLRALIPADSLVYLESNDLGAVMNAITERPAFREAAKTVPDFSVLNGVKLAVAVTGFETKELPVTDENSVLTFTPHFVAVLETNAWNFQAVSFTQDTLGEFINQVYGGEVLLETSDKHDGKYFVWTAKDGRKAFALVQGSVVLFGNDETSIDKCLAVKRGEAESIAKNPKITDGDRLAFGYVSPDGIAQIANIFGLSMASSISEEAEVKTFVARVLPEILRNSLREATWTAKKVDEGIVDSYSIAMNPEIAAVLSETIVPGGKAAESRSWANVGLSGTVTRYNLRDARLAWRSILLAAGKLIDPALGRLVVAFANSLFEPYGIEDGEKFLSSVDPEILTARVGEADETVFVLAKVKDPNAFEQSIAKELRDAKTENAGSTGEFVRRTPDGDFILISETSGAVKLGDPDAVQKPSETTDSEYQKVFESDAAAATYGVVTSAGQVIATIAELKDERTVQTNYFTETRVNRHGIERRTVSDFGFIGWIITQFGKDQ